MRSKKLLSLLLTFCMILSLVAPAGAINAGSNTANENRQNQQVTDNAATSEQDEGFKAILPSKEEVLRGPSDSSDENNQSGPILVGSGKWTATPTTGSGTIANAELPAHIRELREAGVAYADTDRVSAFVLLEADALISSYSSRLDVPMSEEEFIALQQEAVIMAIEEDVLDGEPLQVDSQLSFLTNGIAITTEFGNLEEIAGIYGVKSVFLMPYYYPCEAESGISPYTLPSGNTSGVDTVWGEDYGFTGAGMTIAIIDTGLDLDHPSFAADPADPKFDKEYIASVIDRLNASELYSGLTASKVYRSAKIPFAFNYGADNLKADHDGVGNDHGTHVAGIAGANRLEGSNVYGMAPDTQIIVMKVFNSDSGASAVDIIEALEDSLTLGVDVVNMSLGSAGGFSAAGAEWIDGVYESIKNTNVVVNVAAGNEDVSSDNNMWGTGYNPTTAPDNATISSPSTYANVNSIGSIDNAIVKTTALTLDGAYYAYVDGMDLYMTMTDAFYDGQELEYVLIPGIGSVSDYIGYNVAGKVAVVNRGTSSFIEKLSVAESLGAVALIVVNTDNTTFLMNFQNSDGYLSEEISGITPAIMVGKNAGEALVAMADEDGCGKFTFYHGSVNVNSPTGGQPSDFSSWGVSPDLRLLPDMSGIGGDVYSTTENGTYSYMSGTSMASPQVAGISALVMQYLRTVGNGSLATSDVLDALLMSTAIPVISDDSNVEASPRQQGAGLVNALYAVSSGAYLTVDGATNDGKPKAELGDNANGSFGFTFTVHNFSDEAKTYFLRSSLLTEDVTYNSKYKMYFMAGYDCTLDGSVTFDCGNRITVPAGGTADVNVTIQVSQDGLDFFNTYYPNGGYAEGYVYLDSIDGVSLSLPFMGFCGDWTKADIFDTAYWYDNSFWEEKPVSGVPEGNEFWHIPYVSLGASATDFVLGFSPYTDYELDKDGKIIYDPANNVISPNGDGIMDGITELYLSMMRGAKELHIQYIDANDGTVYLDCCADPDPEMHSYCINVTKTMYLSNYGRIVPFIMSWYKTPDAFTDANGDPLPDGTEIDVVFTAKLDYKGANASQSISFPVTVDVTAPTLVSDVTSVQENGKVYLTFTMKDAHPCYVEVTNPAGTQLVAGVNEFTPVGEDTYSVKVDITGWGNQFMLALCDYGANETYYDLSLSVSNDPVVDTDALYAYRVADASYDYEDYSYFGWVTVDKETGSVTQVTNDIYEDYALTAAEYVDGWIFAFDAGYNFLRIKPGTFFRTEITKLDMEVYDMAWDSVSNTMYVIGDILDSDGMRTRSFAAVDVTTGELTVIGTYDWNSLIAMTVDGNGTVYAVAEYDSNLYTIDKTTGELTVECTLPAADEYSEPMMPSRQQSMTYSEKDGCIYWAYYYEMFYGLGTSALYKIIPAAADTAATVEIVANHYMNSVELVGMLTLEEDEDYTIPAATEVSKLVLSEDEISLAAGSTKTLKVKCLPWNFDLSSASVIWASSDETVATVRDGVVTGIGNGTADITVTIGAVTATCKVSVIVPEGSVNGYSYVENIWFNLDLSTMEYTELQSSPVALISAEYNCHDGYIYGFDERNYFYRMDPKSNEVELLGISPRQIVDLTYDYSTGIMYGVEADVEANLYQIDLSSGQLVKIGNIVDEYGYEVFVLTLACSTDGTLYGISTDPSAADSGKLCTLAYDEFYGAVVATPVIEGLPTMAYVQSMCYDHNTGYIVWAYNDYSTIYVIDPETGIYADLGNTYGSGFMFFGLTSVPKDIPELPDVPVEKLVSEDMLIYVGASRVPSVTVMPLNAKTKTVTWTSADPSIAVVNSDGSVSGVAVGTTTLTATLVDEVAPYDTHTVEIDVTVRESADNLYGYVMANLEDYSSYYWVHIDPTDPSGNTVSAGINEYYMYSAEYVDKTGLVYGYGFDADSEDWTVNFQFMVFDPDNFDILAMHDMGDGFPYVYDMAYDYVTGTMYALAGYNDSSADLYVVDLETGALILAQALDIFFPALVVDETGTIYAISNSVYEDIGWESILVSTSKLYTLDPVAGTCTELFDLGVENNMACSAAYDYDTGCIYWAQTVQVEYGVMAAGLYLIDPVNQTCFSMGVIDSIGAQMSGLFFKCDEYPETPNRLYNILFTAPTQTMKIGNELALNVVTQPVGYEFTGEWTSSDENVAVVDEFGVVTATGVGTTTITVTAEEDGRVVTAQCDVIVFGSDEYLLSYNTTLGGFVQVDRLDPSSVTFLTEGEMDSPVRVMEIVNDIIFAYDENGEFFTTSAEAGYERTYLGTHGIEFEDPSYSFLLRDMAWDPANSRMLVLGTTLLSDEMYGDVFEIYGGTHLYTVDLHSGSLTEIFDFPEEMSSLKALTVTSSGTVYYFTAYDDFFGIVDLENNAVIPTTSLQSQAVYGDDSLRPMAMSYDAMTNSIYLLFRDMNQAAYQIVHYDLNSGRATVDNYLGFVMEENGWFLGDDFAGLIAIEPEDHQHIWGSWVNNGDRHYHVCECGEKEYGAHDYLEVFGSECSMCGAVYVAGKPSTPVTPKPEEPSEPEVPNVPSEPEVPSEPSAPVTPSEPSKPETPGGSTDSGKTDNVVTESPEGVETVTTVDSKGNVLTVEAEIPTDVADSAIATGKPVELPMEPVSNTTKSELAPEITVTTNSDTEIPVEIPVVDPTPGTVVVIVNADGTETVVTTSTISENGVVANLPDGATIKVMDKAMSFDDVSDNDWFSDAVDFVSARGILTGVGEGEFGEADMTSRAMVWTMLARLSGVDTTGGTTWYAAAQGWAVMNGISDGSDPNGMITREQLVTMLWRYVGEPDASASLNGFSDGSAVSSWSEAASQWAVENSVMNGSDGALNPQGITTRAQLAQFIMNFINNAI